MIDLSRNANYLIDAAESKQFVDTIPTLLNKDTMESVGRNLIIKSNALNNTTSSSVGLSKWGYLLSNDKKSFSVSLDENEQYILSFLGHNEGLTNQNVEVAVNGATNEKKTINVISGSNKHNWIFTTDNFKSNEEKTYPLQSLDDWSRYYKNSPAIVTNPNDTAYQKWGFSDAPLENMEQVRGGMFGSALPINGNLQGGIDTPGTAWAGINISRMYLETNDATLLPKIRAIGDFFLNHVMDIDIWDIPLKAMPNAVTFDEVSNQWVPSTRFIHTRTFYHVAWALLEIYDATKDTKYSNLAGQLLDGATMPQLVATGQANSNELPPYFSGAMFNTINNVGEASYEPDWVTFSNTNGDVVVRATNKWIELFGNSTRVAFDLYAWEDRNYTVKSIADNYIGHLLYLYNNQGLRRPDGHNLLYNFSHYEWEDEPHPDGYMIPVPMNWDFIDEVFGKDQWFTGDLMFWAIIGFAEAGETRIATSLLDRYYELKAPDSEGRLLFYDRYTAQGTPLVNDTSKSIAFTGLYMQARNILGNHDYDTESLSSLEYYQKESAFNTVDGGFSWDAEEYNSFIENKSLGEILFSIMENVAKIKPIVTVSFENFISNPVYILDIQLEKGNKATDWTPAPEDLSDLKGAQYFTVKPLQASENYTLFLQKEVTPNTFLGIWIEDYFVGYIRGNSHTFKAPVGEINRIILKTLDELGTIKNARLAGPDSYTHERVRDMLHMKRGSRKVRFRYYLLDKRENKLAEISHLVENGSIEQSAFSDIKRTAKFKLKDCAYRINGEEKEIDWYSDRIQVFVEFEIEKDKWLEYSLGVFLISTPTRKEENQTVYREVEAYDKLLIMKEDKVDYRHTIFAGVRYYDAMVQILESAGINNYNIENNDKRLSNDKEYDPGTEKLSILNDLASDLNFTPFWVDEWGYFRSNQYRSPQEQPEDYIYEDDELSIVGGGIEEELDLFDLPNVFTVVVANPDAEEEYISTIENLNPKHPRSIQNMGRRVVRFEEKDDIADQESLDAYTERLAFQSSQIYGKVKFTTAIMPFHSYSNVLRVKDKTLGIDDKYGETNWKINLEAGANMEHEVRRVVSLT